MIGSFTTDKRNRDVRRGLMLLFRTMSSLSKHVVRSIGGAVLAVSFVIIIPLLVSRAIDTFQSGRRENMALLLTALVVAGLLSAIGIGLRRYYGFCLANQADADLRGRMFEHIQHLGFSFYDKTSTGQLMARASSDLSQVRLLFMMLPLTLANLVTLLAVITMLLLIDPILGLVAALTVPLLLFAAHRYAARVLHLSFSVQERLADLSQVVEEAVGGVQIVKAYAQEAQECSRLDGAADRIFEKTIALARQSAVFSPLFELIPSLGTLAVLWVGGLRAIDGSITLGEFVAFLQYLTLLVVPIRMSGWFFANLPRAAAAAARVDELLETHPTVCDPQEPIELPAGSGEVILENISFAYPGGALVLEGIDLRIGGGTSVALVGAVASGKTTLFHLIPRFHDPIDGRVLLDGVDVRTLRLNQLRREVAVVFQETFLFSASVRENIALGVPNSGDEEIQAAARLAKAHSFICELPENYATIVGERGHSLSGGQRQRIALARAILQDPRVLILDDATSSVDAIVEAEIQTALREVMADRTTIIITHRTSTLALVDRVVFLGEGKVIASGSHEELLASVPRYAALLEHSKKIVRERQA